MMIFIAWAIALISLAVIIFIVIRKFPVLANIDIGEIEAERQAELKRKILNDKFKRSANKVFKELAKFLKPLGRFLGKIFGLLYNRLVNLREAYTEENQIVGEDLAKKIEALFAEAQDLTHKEDLAKAEAKYIEIIGLDSQNYKAFELLGENYFDRENYEEAEQTFEHAIKLKEQFKKAGAEVSDMDLAKTFFSLSLVHHKMNNAPLALEKTKAALELEPNNPRYLDKMVELCIITKDSGAARDYCQRLESSNAGNKKLKEFKDKIRELEKQTAPAEEVAEDNSSSNIPNSTSNIE
jgi:tetratricopeptide (TPR) repeat protein